jgi:hypothetical protein
MIRHENVREIEVEGTHPEQNDIGIREMRAEAATDETTDHASGATIGTREVRVAAGIDEMSAHESGATIEIDTNVNVDGVESVRPRGRTTHDVRGARRTTQTYAATTTRTTTGLVTKTISNGKRVGGTTRTTRTTSATMSTTTGVGSSATQHFNRGRPNTTTIGTSRASMETRSNLMMTRS